jgi:hypothetical protein
MEIDLSEKILYFTEQFEFCKNIEVGDKIYKEGELLKLHKKSYLQGVYRYISKEDKYKTLGYLSELLYLYCCFLKKMITYRVDNSDANFFECINKSILHALKILNETYLHNFKELIVFHNEVSNTFNAFSFSIILQNAEVETE